jgi:hypothetical protein
MVSKAGLPQVVLIGFLAGMQILTAVSLPLLS